MKIMVFLHGTVIMHRTGEGKSRDERVRQVEAKDLAVAEYESYVPVGNAFQKLFPAGTIYFHQEGEQYKDVAERVIPDILIEDDCESIGGELEMTYPHIRSDLQSKIKSIVVKEFAGIDRLPDDIGMLKNCEKVL